MKNKILIGLLVMGLILICGCIGQEKPKESQPSLPADFKQMMIPNTDSIDGILWVNQGESLTYTVNILNFPVVVGVKSSGTWIVPTGEGEVVGSYIEFTSAEQASVANSLINAANINDIWVTASGSRLYVVYGKESYSLKGYIQQGNLVEYQSKYPKLQDTISKLPSYPSEKPIALAIIKPTKNLKDYLTILSQNNPELKSSADSLDKAGINEIAVGLYSSNVISLNAIPSMDDVKNLGLSVFAVGKSSYPGVLLDIFFGGEMSKMGFTETYLDNGKKVYYKNYDGVHVYVANSGSYIFASTSADYDNARNLMRSAFGIPV